MYPCRQEERLKEIFHSPIIEVQSKAAVPRLSEDGEGPRCFVEPKANMKRILFVDDDPAQIVLLRKAFAGLESEWETLFFRRPAEALEEARNRPFDAIITDMRMPGMTGADLLAVVREEVPSALRIILSGTVVENEASRAVGPAHMWLPKPCNVDFLYSVIERGTAWRAFLTEGRVADCVGRLETLPSVPQLYLSLVEELRSPDTSFRRVAEIIAQDPGMAAKLLKMVNSAFFGLNCTVTNLDQAVGILGLTMIKALVLSVKVFSEFDQRKIPEFSIDRLMNHSVAVSSMARTMVRAETKDRRLCDDAFVAGLLHDIGKLILADNMPKEYAGVLRSAAEDRNSLREGENKVFGATHAEVGAYLLALWGMPDPVVATAAYHHRPADGEEQGFGCVAAVHVADAFDRVVEDPLQGEPDVDAAYLQAIGKPDRVETWMDLCNVLTR